MKKSLKATLLSTLALPGAGHYFLNKRPVAYALMGLSLTMLLAIFFRLVNLINSLVVDISTGKLALNVSDISEAVHQQMQLSMGSYIDVFIVLWVVAGIDAYRLGVIADKAER